MKLKQIRLLIACLLILVFAAFFLFKDSLLLKRKTNTSIPSLSLSDSKKETEKPQIVTTKPDPLDDVIIPASQIIEITFNKALENSGELKVGIDPKADFKIELSSDRKTARILPGKPYELGITYTMSIGPETKFDGVGRWGEEKVFHFRTIKYRGI